MEPSDIVMADFETGTYVPRLTGGKSFAGHGQFTIDSATKHKLIGEFYSSTMSRRRREIIEAFNVRYVFFGPYERARGLTASDLGDWRVIYNNGSVMIFDVRISASE